MRDFVTYVDNFDNEFDSPLAMVLYHLTGDEKYLLK